MYIYQQRDTLLNLQNLTAITITGRFAVKTVNRIEAEPGTWQMEGMILTPRLVQGDFAEGKCLGAVRVNLEGSIFEETLSMLDSLFDEIYGYYQLLLQNQMVDALLDTSAAPVSFDVEEILKMLRRTGDSDRLIENQLGITSATVDDWEDGNVALDAASLAGMVNGWPLMPWDYLIGHFHNN